MKTRIVAVLLTFFALQFAISCCKDFRYFDFDEMEHSLSSTEIGQQDSLWIWLFPINIRYLSMHLEGLGFSPALSFKCDEGWGGMKYPFNTIAIVSNEDFDDNHPAGQSLNDLFLVRIFKGNGNFEWVPLNSNMATNSGDIQLVIAERPTLAKQHVFTIKLVKMNDEEITLETEAITWE